MAGLAITLPKVVAEVQHEAGRRGARRVKRLLEATLRFKLPYDAYKNPERVSLTMLTGHKEAFDLKGDFLSEEGLAVTHVFVESKNQAGAGNQSTEFKRFLAEVYSATKHRLGDYNDGDDPKYEFLWATRCPWIGDGFTQVATGARIVEAADWDRDRDPEKPIGGRQVPKAIPDDHQVDEEVARRVSRRIIVWVISERQEDMIMGRKLRGWVQERLEAEADGGEEES